MERTILHCDCNGFYASVECVLHPELRSVPMAVCGDPESRRGIILAKNELAKGYGIKTAETIWQAKRKCPQLVLAPAHHDQYALFSKRINGIYQRYTDLVEPFSIDESWLDVTGSQTLFGTPYEIAETIRQQFYSQLGLTVSVGVSFNKIFAKLASDLKKPNATTVITKEDFQEKIWKLPVESMLGVGRATLKKLHESGVFTIGELAQSNENYLYAMFGKNGSELWQNANGRNESPVSYAQEQEQPKSIGNSITCPKDLEQEEQAQKVLLYLSEKVAGRMLRHGVLACGIHLMIKDCLFQTRQYQQTIEIPTRQVKDIYAVACRMLKQHYKWKQPIRALGISGFLLVPQAQKEQVSFFTNTEELIKEEKLEEKIANLKEKYGKQIITYGALLSKDFDLYKEDINNQIPYRPFQK